MRFRSVGWAAGAVSASLAWLLCFVFLFILAGCGSIVAPPDPCTLERASAVQHDSRGRVVLYACTGAP